MPRLFVAVWPPADVVAAMAALPRPTVDGLRWTGPQHWHVTLRFLGNVEDASTVAEALAGVDAAAVDVTAGPAVERFGGRILHVPVHGLTDVASAVVDATHRLGQPPEERPFAGHLTIARVVRNAHVRVGSLAGAPISGHWSVTEMTLVESRLSPAGARYEVIETFPLRG